MNIETKHKINEKINVDFKGLNRECIINTILVTIDEDNGVNILYSVIDLSCRNNQRIINEKDLNKNLK